MSSWASLLVLLVAGPVATASVVFDATSPYHHIRVIDEGGLRTLSFDGSMETRMSLTNPAQGHFEYTDDFQMPWLWNERITNVLMIGLGGSEHTTSLSTLLAAGGCGTAELDAMVVKVARQHFYFTESPTNRVDGFRRPGFPAPVGEGV